MPVRSLVRFPSLASKASISPFLFPIGSPSFQPSFSKIRRPIPFVCFSKAPIAGFSITVGSTVDSGFIWSFLIRSNAFFLRFNLFCLNVSEISLFFENFLSPVFFVVFIFESLSKFLFLESLDLNCCFIWVFFLFWFLLSGRFSIVLVKMRLNNKIYHENWNKKWINIKNSNRKKINKPLFEISCHSKNSQVPIAHF